MAGGERKNKTLRIGSTEEKQGKSGMEKYKRTREVSFRQVIDEEGKQVKEMIGAMKIEIIKELERLKEEWRRKMREVEGKIRVMESDRRELKEKRRKRKEERRLLSVDDRSIG